jgi:hypothetical protein
MAVDRMKFGSAPVVGALSFCTSDNLGRVLLLEHPPREQHHSSGHRRNDYAHFGSSLASLVLISGLSYNTTFNKELWISSLPLYSI